MPSQRDDPRTSSAKQRFRSTTATSVWKSPEMARFLWIAGLVAFIAIFFFIYSQGDELAPPPAAEIAGTANVLTPEELEERQRALYGMFEGALVDQENGQDFRESPGYLKLIEVLSSYTPEEVHAEVDRVLSREQVLEQPDAWRGEFVSVRGVLAGLYAVRLPRPVLGRNDIYRGALTDDDRPAVVVDVIDHPGDVQPRQGAYEAEGIFYRTVAYEAEDGTRRTAPWLLVRSLTPISSRGADRKGFLREKGPTALVLAGVVIFGGRLLMYWFHRRRRRAERGARPGEPSIREMFEQRLREERGASTPPAAPPSDPPTRTR